MIKLRVQYTAQLRTVIGRHEDEVELPPGSNVAGLLDHLASALGDGAAAHLVAPGGQRPRNLLVVVNDSAAPAYVAAHMLLKNGDVVLLLPPIAGG
jgi:molybdopterin converting factor small subunit